MPYERSYLARESIFLALEKGSGPDPVKKEAFSWPLNPSLCRAPDIAGMPYQMQS